MVLLKSEICHLSRASFVYCISFDVWRLTASHQPHFIFVSLRSLELRWHKCILTIIAQLCQPNSAPYWCNRPAGGWWQSHRDHVFSDLQVRSLRGKVAGQSQTKAQYKTCQNLSKSKWGKSYQNPNEEKPIKIKMRKKPLKIEMMMKKARSLVSLFLTCKPIWWRKCRWTPCSHWGLLPL